MIRALNEKGVCCGIHYPIPVYLQNAYRSLATSSKQNIFISEKYASKFLSLPMFPEYTDAQIEYVSFCIRGSIKVDKSLLQL